MTEALRLLQNYETYFKARVRKRRRQDQMTFEVTVGALMCDMIHRELTAPGAWVAVPLSKTMLGRRDRYSSRALGKTLPAILQRMTAPEMGYAELIKGAPGPFGTSRQTTMRAGSRLRDRIASAGLSLDDLGRQATDEVIMLKGPREARWDAGALIDYKDTPRTRTYRSEIERINSWLARADISFDPAAAPDKVVDDTDRHLRRYFNNGSFKAGGRLFGGFWQELKKRERGAGITIESEPVVMLDYAQMGPRILYSLAGATPPDHDAYLIPGLDHHREGVKRLFGSLLFATKAIGRFPKGVRELFPRGVLGAAGGWGDRSHPSCCEPSLLQGGWLRGHVHREPHHRGRAPGAHGSGDRRSTRSRCPHRRRGSFLGSH